MLVRIETDEVDRATQAAFRAEVVAALAAHLDDAAADAALVLDLTDVRFLDSGGIRVLVDAERVVLLGGGRLEVLADGLVRRALEVTGVWSRLAGEHVA